MRTGSVCRGADDPEKGAEVSRACRTENQVLRERADQLLCQQCDGLEEHDRWVKGSDVQEQQPPCSGRKLHRQRYSAVRFLRRNAQIRAKRASRAAPIPAKTTALMPSDESAELSSPFFALFGSSR